MTRPASAWKWTPPGSHPTGNKQRIAGSFAQAALSQEGIGPGGIRRREWRHGVPSVIHQAGIASLVVTPIKDGLEIQNDLRNASIQGNNNTRKALPQRNRPNGITLAIPSPMQTDGIVPGIVGSGNLARSSDRMLPCPQQVYLDKMGFACQDFPLLFQIVLSASTIGIFVGWAEHLDGRNDTVSGRDVKNVQIVFFWFLRALFDQARKIVGRRHYGVSTGNRDAGSQRPVNKKYIRIHAGSYRKNTAALFGSGDISGRQKLIEDSAHTGNQP